MKTQHRNSFTYATLFKRQLKETDKTDVAFVMGECCRMYLMHAIGVEVDLDFDVDNQYDMVIKLSAFQDAEFHSELIDVCFERDIAVTDSEIRIKIHTLADAYFMHGVIHYIY